MLDALAHAHRAGIVHRDVKPANILLEDRDELAVRLLDFGLAQFDGADTLTAAGDVPGTLAYIAPERLAGDRGDAGERRLVGRRPALGGAGRTVTRSGACRSRRSHRRSRRALRLSSRSGATFRAGSSRPSTARSRADPAARPNASMLAAELRNALRKAATARARANAARAGSDAAPALRHARRVAPIALAVLRAALGATLLPFWPPALVAALVARSRPRGLVRPTARARCRTRGPGLPARELRRERSRRCTARSRSPGWSCRGATPAAGSSSLSGPVLAGLGLLALVPLVVQPARGVVRRAVQAALAVLAAALVAGVEARGSPLASGPRTALGIGPSGLRSRDALAALEQPRARSRACSSPPWLSRPPPRLLPWARQRSRSASRSSDSC